MSILRSLRIQYRPATVVALRILTAPVVLLCNNLELADELAQYFASHVVDLPEPHSFRVYLLQGEPVFDPKLLKDVPRTEPGKGVKESYYDTLEARIVVKARTGVTVYVAEPDHYVVGDLLANFNQAVNAVNMVFAKAILSQEYLLLHASAVIDDRGGVAFTSLSGAGKSTVALALLDRGYRFVTNDRLFVRPVDSGVEMVGVPKKPRVNPGTMLSNPRLSTLVSRRDRERYMKLNPQELWKLEEKRDVDLDSVYGTGVFQLVGQLQALYFLKWNPNGQGWQVSQLNREEGLSALLEVSKGVGIYDPSPPWEDERRCLLHAVAKSIPIYQVEGRTDIPRLVELIQETPKREL